MAHANPPFRPHGIGASLLLSAALTVLTTPWSWSDEIGDPIRFAIIFVAAHLGGAAWWLLFRLARPGPGDPPDRERSLMLAATLALAGSAGTVGLVTSQAPKAAVAVGRLALPWETDELVAAAYVCVLSTLLLGLGQALVVWWWPSRRAARWASLALVGLTAVVGLEWLAVQHEGHRLRSELGKTVDRNRLLRAALANQAALGEKLELLGKLAALVERLLPSRDDAAGAVDAELAHRADRAGVRLLGIWRGTPSQGEFLTAAPVVVAVRGPRDAFRRFEQDLIFEQITEADASDWAASRAEVRIIFHGRRPSGVPSRDQRPSETSTSETSLLRRWSGPLARHGELEALQAKLKAEESFRAQHRFVESQIGALARLEADVKQGVYSLEELRDSRELTSSLLLRHKRPSGLDEHEMEFLDALAGSRVAEPEFR